MGTEKLTELSAGKPVATSTFNNRTPFLTTNGALLFCSDRKGNDDIWELASDSTTPVKLTDGGGIKSKPVVSPDERWIAMNIKNDEGSYSYFASRDGRGIHPIAPDIFDKYTVVLDSR